MPKTGKASTVLGGDGPCAYLQRADFVQVKHLDAFSTFAYNLEWSGTYGIEELEFSILLLVVFEFPFPSSVYHLHRRNGNYVLRTQTTVCK
jgi:hypothetical protein